ncbi:MAG TPA: NAD(P)H-dependent oxidoreductase, partial [Candidatus Synoicihabitans sp.]|nr:NAD(P)H-dependent oxidoreductase [Candidatus Synoicihabitans sp.]
MRPNLLVLNASIGGAHGNTASALTVAHRWLRRRSTVTTVVLDDHTSFDTVRPALAAAQGFVIGTGIHWDSWSSRLQRLLEAATPTEATSLWLGKPAACVVTEHSVGGKAVLSRLQGVLVTLGCEIPPMSGLVLSRATRTAAASDRAAARDYWGPDDLRVVCHNLIEAVNG